MKAIALVVLLLASVAQASLYKITVSRVSDNLYKVMYGNGRGTVIKTRYCYEFATYEDVILDWDGYSGKIIFSSGQCDVEAVVQ
jgi:hypothetical protein